MPGYLKNPWITFLRQYGPVASNDAMYDEHVLNSARRNGVAPLRFDSGGILEEITSNFRGNAPKSVILTGTAGDGKTWLCREVWQALGGSEQVWGGDEKVRRLALPAGATLVVLKDLSEIRSEELGLLSLMAESFYADRPREVFLMAANDGRLRQAWELAPRDTLSVAAAATLVEDLLVEAQLRTERAGLVLYNLSRQDSAKLMTRVIDALLAHEGWSRCNGCAGQSAEGARCPVWVNQERLRGSLLRERLTDLLTLCDQSGFHLPVRQLLILASNMLLGHPDGKDRLLRCQEVEGVVREAKGHLGSIYRNAFGENLTESRRESTAVFDTLRRFGIGEETCNGIDNLLVYGQDDPELRPHFETLFGNDPEYGANQRFRESLDVYLDGREAASATPFTEIAVAQRQRLFFTTPRDRVETLGVWELTVFRFAGEFLDRVLRPLAGGAEGRVDEGVLRRLVRGLNRVFTGRLTNDTGALWLASSGSHSQARVSRIFEFKIAVRDPMRRQGVSLRGVDGRPTLVVTLDREVEESLPLHLVRFEFLLRVAEGALPSNFSRECYEDVLAFKSRLLRSASRIKGDESEPLDLTLLKLDASGLLREQHINIVWEGDR